MLRGSGRDGSFLGDLRFGSSFLGDQECGQSLGVFITHGAVRFDGTRTQRLRIFHPLVNPSSREARTNLRERGSHVALVGLAIDNVASLTGIFAVEELLPELDLTL